MLPHYLVKCKWSSVQLYIHISKNITLYVRRHLFYESLLVYLSFLPDTDVIMTLVQYLPARRRPQGLVVIGVCLSVCLSVCAHCFCPQNISRTGSWITTKFGGWEQGVNL